MLGVFEIVEMWGTGVGGGPPFDITGLKEETDKIGVKKRSKPG